ncbi:helix-turn-helix domain-containing protein [Methylocapsa acidiphila]|uniref:AraC-like ligand-binding domain-containing protein n=1 Tax=Methylocapsa acidiphila TaxID=133552 RepID=UPI0006874CED|nr:helix-turn-helix domain-containing protein [Methylocapsa acidiphila]
MVNGVKLCTEDLPLRQRPEWLREVIGREYADVEIAPPKDAPLFNEMIIYPWRDLRLSSIRSNAIGIERPAGEPRHDCHDAYLAVVLLSGEYRLEQDGREAVLRPGDMAIYDAARPHNIICPTRFVKLIVSIPRALLREKAAGVEHCTARRIDGGSGLGAVTADFVRSAARRAGELSQMEFSALSGPCADLLALALTSVQGRDAAPERGRAMTKGRLKRFVEQRLHDPDLDVATIAAGVGLSPRYANDLFREDGASPMRYVWRRRLEHCRDDLLSAACAGRTISDIAFGWGFNDLSHFSRAFKQTYGASPRDYRLRHAPADESSDGANVDARRSHGRNG